MAFYLVFFRGSSFLGEIFWVGGGYVYEYDMENRLTKVSRSDSTVVATFAYDALGRRIETVDASAGTTRWYCVDGQSKSQGIPAPTSCA